MDRLLDSRPSQMFTFALKRPSASNQNQGPPLPQHLILGSQETAQTPPTRWAWTFTKKL
jgi:hypothetical protein